MQNILEWGDKNGPHRKTFTKRKKSSKIRKQIVVCSIYAIVNICLQQQKIYTEAFARRCVSALGLVCQTGPYPPNFVSYWQFSSFIVEKN